MRNVTVIPYKPCVLIKIFDPTENKLRSKITRGNFSSNSDDNKYENYIIELYTDTKLNSAANSAEIKILNGSMQSGQPELKMQDRIEIWLGYENPKSVKDPYISLVFSGEISGKKVGVNECYIESISKLNSTTTGCLDQSFSKVMTIEDLLKKLVEDYGNIKLAKMDISETSISKQKGFAISNNFSVFDQVQKLVELTGIEMYADVNDELRFETIDPNKLKYIERQPHEKSSYIFWIPARGKNENDTRSNYLHDLDLGSLIIDFGIDYMNLKFQDRELFNPLDNSTMNSTFTLNPMNICKKNKIDIKEKYEIGLVKTSGQHLNKRLLTHFSKNDLIRIRDNLTKKFKKRLIGRLEIIGSPQIRLNDGVRLHNIQIEKFEIDKIIFKVVRVEHLFNMLNGYVTRIYLEELLQ